MVDISCIIVNWNTKGLTETAVQSIIDTCPDELHIQIIVVDNASSDGSVCYLKETFDTNPSITILALDRNIGYGPGHNRGLSIAKGDWIFFLNSDIMILEGCLLEMYKVSISNKLAGIYAPRILNPDYTDQDVFGHLFPIKWDLFIKLFSRKQQMALQNEGDIKYFQSIAGVAYFVSKEYLAMHGAWAEEYIMFTEDLDFCMRVHLAGKKCIMIPNAKMIHFGQASSKMKWSTEKRNRAIQITNWLFAKKYADPFLWEIYWIYAFLKSMYRGYHCGISWERDRVHAKLWFVSQLIKHLLSRDKKHLFECLAVLTES